MQKITTELKINTGSMLEFIVLKMLSGETHSIGEIYEELKSIGFKTPMGSLYPLLSKFRRKNYVVTGYEEGDTKPVIRTYDLTEKGRQRLGDLRSDWKRLNSLVASLGSR
jgi:PadR family transcriptional regulator PadR